MVLINAVTLAPAISSTLPLMNPLERLGFVAAESFTGNSIGAALAGGAVLGAATMAKYRTNGNVLGVSGIVDGLTRPNLTAQDALDRFSFLAGLLIAGFALRFFLPDCLGRPVATALTLGGISFPRQVVAGGLVGYGSARGSGCTSGHGIFGNARLSKRSIAATASFLLAGIGSAAIFCTAKSCDLSSILTSVWPPRPLTSLAMAGGVLFLYGTSIISASKATEAKAISRRQGQRFVDLVTGLTFGLALGLSGMLNPCRVSKFFDIKSPDLTLAFVIGGALAIAAPCFALIPKKKDGDPKVPPIIAEDYSCPSRTRPIDTKLITGAIIFGTGWGMMGLCPAPALISLTSASTWPDFKSIALFDSAMALGWAIHHRFKSFRNWIQNILRKP